MKFYKIFLAFTISILSFNYIVLADDENEELSDNLSSLIEVSSSISDEPTINSRAAIVYDRTSGSILFGKNEKEQRKMASTTKIMTAIIVLENANLNDVVTVSSRAAGTGGSRLGLHTNDKISIRDLLYGLMLCSGNDAAVALAEHVGGDLSGFASLMNAKCDSLKLNSTHFVTPHGLDNDEHFTTAYELAIITNYALQNETFCNYVGTKHYTVSINGRPKNLSNTNELLGNLNGVYGVKTGFTNGANRCLVTSVKRDNIDLICIVLGADTKKDRTRDSIQLIEYAFKNFEMINIKEKILTEFDNWKLCNSSSIVVNKGLSNNLDLYLEDIPFDFFPVNCNQTNNISIYIYCSTSFEAPLATNSSLGYLTVSINEKTVITLNIYNSNFIPKKDYNDFWQEMIRNYTSYLETLLYKKI
ncbi:MAG: D-alanyl-D-alanine carboxypeptidase [Clostridia bacterium]|nr:D-alanyl-D-alanine carboxypeptidase [Clostridia bacterium]